MPDANDTLNILHELIEVCRDGQTGYTHAAVLVKDAGLKAFFDEQGIERRRFVQELKAEAKRLGEEDPDTSGSAAAVLHRIWFETKADIGMGDESIVGSVERGEDSAKKAYEKALSAPLPETVREIVAAQAQRILSAHDRVRAIRDGKAA